MATLLMSSETITPIAQDTFVRGSSNSGTFGTSSDGTSTWTKYGTGALSTSTTEGIVSATTGNIEVILGAATTTDTDVTFRYSLSASGDYVGLIARFQNSNNYYAAYYNGGSYRIYRFVNGSATQIQSFSFTTTVGSFYFMRFRIVGTQLQLKVWLASNAEPTAFNTSIVDSTYTSAGNVGIVVKTATASPGGPSIDSFVGSSYSNADVASATDAGTMSLSNAALNMQGTDTATVSDTNANTAITSLSDTTNATDVPAIVLTMQGGDTSTDTTSANDSGTMTQGANVMYSYGGLSTTSSIDSISVVNIPSPLDATTVQDNAAIVLSSVSVDTTNVNDTSASVGLASGYDTTTILDYDASQLIISAASQLIGYEADTFGGRTVTANTNVNGFGVASNGDTWTRSGTAVTMSVQSGEGRVASPTGNAYMTLGAATGTDGDVAVRFAVTSSSDIPGVLLRYTNTNNFYRLDVTGGLLRMRKVVGGTSTYFGTPNYVITNGTFYWMHMKVVGTNVYGRAWQDGSAEPNTWQVQGSDAQLTSGQAGLYINPISSTPIQMDSFTSSVITSQTLYADSTNIADSSSIISTMSGVSATQAIDSGSLRGPTLTMQGIDATSALDTASITSVASLFEQSAYGTQLVTRTQIEQVAHDTLNNEFLNGWNPNAYYTGNGANIPGGLWINWEWNNPSNTNRQGDGVTNQSQYQTAHDPQTCCVYLHALSEYLLLHPEDTGYFSNKNVVGTNLGDFTAHVINDFTGYTDIKFFVYLDVLQAGLNLGNTQLITIAQGIAYNQMNDYKYGYFWKQHANGSTYTSNYAIGEAAIVLDNALRYPTQSYTGTGGTVYAVSDMIAAAKSAIDHIISIAIEPNYGLFYDQMNVDSTGNGADTPYNSSNTCLCRASTQIEAAECLFIAANILNNPANATLNSAFYDPIRAQNYIGVANTCLQAAYQYLWDDGSTITTSALTLGATYTSINVQSTPYDYPIGTPIIIGNTGSTQQTVYVTQDAPAGYALLKVASVPGGANFVASANFAAGQRVSPSSTSTVPLTNGGFFFSIETNYYKSGTPNTTLDPTKYVFNKAYKETRSTAVMLRTAKLAHTLESTFDSLMQQCVATLIDPTKFYKVDPANSVNSGFVYELNPDFSWYDLHPVINGVKGIFQLSQDTTEALGTVADSLLQAQSTGIISQTSATTSSSVPPQYLADSSNSISVMSGSDKTPDYTTDSSTLIVPWTYSFAETNIVTTMSGVSPTQATDSNTSSLLMSGMDGIAPQDTQSLVSTVNGNDSTTVYDNASTLTTASQSDSASSTDSGYLLIVLTMSGVSATSAQDTGSTTSIVTPSDSASATDTASFLTTMVSSADIVNPYDTGLLTNTVFLMSGISPTSAVDAVTMLLTVAISDVAPVTDKDTSTLLPQKTDTTMANDSGVLYVSQVVMFGTDATIGTDASQSVVVSVGTDATTVTDIDTSMLLMSGIEATQAIDSGVLYISFSMMIGVDIAPTTDSAAILTTALSAASVVQPVETFASVITLQSNDTTLLVDMDTSTLLMSSGTSATIVSDSGAIILTTLLMSGISATLAIDTVQAVGSLAGVDGAVLYEYGSMALTQGGNVEYVTQVFTFRDRTSGIAVSGSQDSELATWYQGQTYPFVLIVCRTARDHAVDLSQVTGITVTMHPMKSKTNAQDATLTGTVAILNKRQGIASLQFASSDVSVPGSYQLYVSLLYAGRPFDSDPVVFNVLAN